MKKTMIMMAVLALSFGAAKAQGVHFGIKAGANFSELHGENIKNNQTKVGAHAGFLAHIHTSSPSWGIQPEVMYSLEGAKFDAAGVKSTTDLHYVKVPVLAQYMFANGWRVEAGPQIGFLAAAKAKTGNTTVNVKDDYKSIDFSIPVGLGYLTRYGLGFDARYNFGISDINNTNVGGKVTGNNFQFGLFYQFSDTKMK